MRGLLVIAVCLVCAVSASRVFPEFTSPLAAPSQWFVDTAAEAVATPKAQSLDVLLSRSPAQVAALQSFFDAVSDPASPTYGQYKTQREMDAMMAAPAKSVSAVRAFLASHGLRVERLASDALRATGTPAQINAAFATELRLFRNRDTNATIWRSVEPYSLPAHLRGTVDLVSGIHHFPEAKRVAKKSFPTKVRSPLDAPLIGPNDLRTRYNVTDFSAGRQWNATQAVAEFQGQYYSQSDLTQFFQQYQPGNYVQQPAGVIGPNQGGDPGVEAELDIQYIMGVNPNSSTYFYSQASNDFWSDLTSWIAILKADPRPPLVHSISYGEQAEHQTSEAYKVRFDQEMQALGSRGLTIIFASGDSGTGCSLCYRFDPSFPATSPSVTTVGATQFDQSSPPYTSESAVSQFGSGGGFSYTFPRPAYQNAAVSGYFNTSHLPASFHWNRKGRATPDVAALGIGFSVVVSGGVESIGGTSASAPTFAAIASLLNEQQLKRGRPPLGFLNPWLYSVWGKSRAAFWDVTLGNNADGCCVHGFECEVGYDAVTGLGTPNYRVLKQFLP